MNQMHAHIKAGWSYCPFTGSRGGWIIYGEDTNRIVCRDTPRGKWHYFLVRRDDGATLEHTTHSTRNAAMGISRV